MVAIRGVPETKFTVRRAVAKYVDSFQAQPRSERVYTSLAIVRGAFMATSVAVSFDHDCHTSAQGGDKCDIVRIGELCEALCRRLRYVFAARQAGVTAGSFGKAIAFLTELDGHLPNEPWQQHERDPYPPSPLTLTRWLAAHNPQSSARGLSQIGKSWKPTALTQWWEAAGRARNAK